MPTFHSILVRFNLKFLIGSESHAEMHYAILGLNLAFIFIMVFSMSNLVTELPKKNFFRKQLQQFNLLVFQIYNWLLIVPMLHFSGYGLLTESFVAIANLLLLVFLGNAIEILEINVSFKLDDHLAQTHVFSNRILNNYKLFIVIITGFDYFNEPLVLSFYIWALFEYINNPNYHSHLTSMVYFSAINFSIFSGFAYFLTGNNLLLRDYLDLAYLLLFAATVLTKYSMKLLDFLVTAKIERIITVKGLVDVKDFQLYNREIYRHFTEAGDNLNSRIVFLTFFATHQNNCHETDCKCSSVQLKNKGDFLKHKRVFLGLLNLRFQEFLGKCNEKDFPQIFLNFCSFILTVLKTPSKVLNLLFSQKKHLKTLGDQLQAEILIKRAKKLLEKKLLNNDRYAQSLASVIMFDKEVQHVELRLKRIVQDMLKINDLLLQDTQAATRFLQIGGDILRNLEKFKDKIMKLLDKNVKNLRLIQLTALTIKYLTEDLAFRNYYKQLNIKRINFMLMRKSHDALDIFDHDSGIVFISLGRDFTAITKISKNFLRVFGYSNPSEIIGKTLDFLMPQIFGMRHSSFIRSFVDSGKGRFLVSNLRNVFAVNKQGFVMEIQLLIRLDTVYHDEFVIAAYLKLQKNLNNRFLALDAQGTLLNSSRECDQFFGFGNKPQECLINIGVILPETIDRLFPIEKEEFLSKNSLEFKHKGFALIPRKEQTYSELNCPQNFKVVPCFNEIKAKDIEIENVKKREIIYDILRKVNTQDYRFFRVHYNMKTLSFADKRVDIRILEILDSFELMDIRLFSQYLSRKTEKLKMSLQKTHNFSPPHSMEVPTEPKPKSGTAKVNYNLTIEKDFMRGDSNLSASNRESPTQKLKEMTILNKELSYSPSNSAQNINELDNKQIINEINSNEPSSNQDQVEKGPPQQQKQMPNQLFPPNQGENVQDGSKQTISASFEAEESEFSLGLDNDLDFEQKISELSNNLANRLSSDDSLTHQEERTQTYNASQISRVSSHASGDAKKGTMAGLMKTGGGKLAIFEIFGFGSFLGYIGITILFFMLEKQEGNNLQRTIGNSGLFHDQLSPVCVLMRDVQAYEWTYKGMLNNTSYLQEIRRSFEFSSNLLEQSYKAGIEQTDASMDFMYTTYLTVKLKNLTLFSFLAPNGSILPISSALESLDTNIRLMVLDIPKALIFFLAASQHVLFGYALNQSQSVSDLENYHWFLKENILELISSMLAIFKMNKVKINESVGYLKQLNWVLILMIGLLTLGLCASSGYFSMKNKLKCEKFCLLFWFFPENELAERGNKLSSILERYFDQTRKAGFEKIHYTDPTTISQTNSTSKFNTLSRSYMRSEMKFEGLIKRKKGKLRRSNSINLTKNWGLQRHLLITLGVTLCLMGLIVGVYMIFYTSTSAFIDNTLDIMNDIDCLETYSITISIRYAINSVILGMFDQNNQTIQQKSTLIKTLLDDIEYLQASITDLSQMFKKTGSSNILSDLKFNFFTKDLCLVSETLKTQANFAKLATLLGSKSFCDKLLKNILTKGSTSLVFSVNELFQGWQLLMSSSGYNLSSLMEIIQSQEYLDANLALAYVYAIGKFYSNEMQDKTGVYFESVRNTNIIWIVFTLFMALILFGIGFRRLMRYMRENLKETFSMIQLFPFSLIGVNKVLENKISKIFRLQKI